MKVEWDENKRTINLQRHDFDFIGVEAVFENVRYTILDNRFDYGEVRFVTFGFLQGRVVAVVHTHTDGDIIRVISVRKATKNEQRKFYKTIADQLGEN
jgi:uncharacterized protein